MKRTILFIFALIFNFLVLEAQNLNMQNGTFNVNCVTGGVLFDSGGPGGPYKELTEEYNMTTVINTHDMNSVMGIGDQVTFLHQGLKEWEGSKEEIMTTDNKELSDFIFASDFLKQLRDKANK